MRLLTTIITIYTICLYVESQLVYPDNPLLKINFYSPVIPAVHQNRLPDRNVLHPGQRAAKGPGDNVEQTISSGISKLALSINNFYLNQRSLDNVVLSPVSIASALALVLLGSNGLTFDEIGRVLRLIPGTDLNSNSLEVHESLGRLLFKLNQSSLTDQLNIAAALFVQNNFPIRELYKETSERIYKNEIVNLDFLSNNVHAQHAINAWISSKTNGKITSILAEPPPEETKVIIASALYFNGAWEKQFWEGFTRRLQAFENILKLFLPLQLKLVARTSNVNKEFRDKDREQLCYNDPKVRRFEYAHNRRPFYQNGRKEETNIEVEMMSNGGLFPYHKDTQLACDIMGFPYKGNATTMYVVIPENSNPAKLKLFEESLTPDDIKRLVESTVYTQSVILFPKMKLEATSNLREPLRGLGLKSLFNPFEANLALLSPGIKKNPSMNTKEIHKSPLDRSKSVGSDISHALVFSRAGFPLKCTQIFNPNSNMSECEEIDMNTHKQVAYKKFGDKLGRRVTRESINTIDKLRAHLNKDGGDNVENPALYADQVIHKVYVDITEQGTEAAASTSVSLTRGGDITIFRADIPFLFFIWHEETKLILFWGSVYEPIPHFS